MFDFIISVFINIGVRNFGMREALMSYDVLSGLFIYSKSFNKCKFVNVFCAMGKGNTPSHLIAMRLVDIFQGIKLIIFSRNFLFYD
jgi:hypothetical protein